MKICVIEEIISGKKLKNQFNKKTIFQFNTASVFEKYLNSSLQVYFVLQIIIFLPIFEFIKRLDISLTCSYVLID